MNPLISVLIPTYNCAAYLGQALDSVFAQTYRNVEVIVVDDGSEDDTAAVVSRYPAVRYFRKDHGGVSAARNFAITQAQGKYIAFLDADDLWTPGKLEKQAAYLGEHPDCQLVFCLTKNFFDDAPETLTLRQKQLLHARVDYCLPAACIRKEVFQRYGLFCEGLPFGEDTHWTARLLAAGVCMDHDIPEVLYLRRIHQNNISLTHIGMPQKSVLPLMASAIRQARKEQNKR